MADIKETKEGLIGVFAVAKLFASRLGDGFQMDDISALLDALKNDEDFKAKLLAAYQDGHKIADEVKELSLLEMADLAYLLISEGIELLAIFKAKPPVA